MVLASSFSSKVFNINVGFKGEAPRLFCHLKQTTSPFSSISPSPASVGESINHSREKENGEEEEQVCQVEEKRPEVKIWKIFQLFYKTIRFWKDNYMLI